MRKRRLILMVTIMLVFVLLLTLSSAIFELKYIDICFFDNKGNMLNITQNQIYNSKEKVNKIISSTNFEYGQSLFIMNSSEYTFSLENKNPYLKVINIESIFPNKLIINAQERKKLFYIQSLNEDFIFDSEFKLLEKGKSLDKTNLINFAFQNRNGGELSFFDFFEISSFALDAGQFLNENNKVFIKIDNCVKIIKSYFEELLTNTSKFIIEEEESNLLNLKINTCNILGITLEVKDIFNDFDKKLNKIMQSFLTLYNTEKIKTTYGRIVIDKNCNCYWYEK